MNSKQAKKLFAKYLRDECTERERAVLEEYLHSYQDKGKLWAELRFEENIKDKIWAKIQAETVVKVETKSASISLRQLLKYAAVFIGVALGMFFWAYLQESPQVESSLVIQEQKVVLRTANATNTIDETSTGQINSGSGNVVATQEGNVIIYNNDASITELVYNEIEVPRGKTFKLVLSDGSTVQLNSSTVFRFPVNFLEGQERKVFLKGEAYFEISHDSERPFKVNADEMDVTVLGTTFNVSSYEGSATNTVLVEGSVAVQQLDENNMPGEQEIIVPGQKATIASDKIEVARVNVSDYIGWIQDQLVFQDETFSEIIRKIERKYNVDIQNNYNELSPVRFNGKFSEESIIDLMNTFKESAGFDYHIADNKVIINKKKAANEMKNEE